MFVSHIDKHIGLLKGIKAKIESEIDKVNWAVGLSANLRSVCADGFSRRISKKWESSFLIRNLVDEAAAPPSRKFYTDPLQLQSVC